MDNSNLEKEKELAESIATFVDSLKGSTQLQIEEALKESEFEQQEIIVQGVLSDVQGSRPLYLSLYTKTRTLFYCGFDPSCRETLLGLNRETKITVRGKVQGINRSFVHLMECELISD